jgi:dTDP-4-dehydrorhamnose reductase
VLESEAAALVLRTAWLFGAARQSFVSTVLDQVRNQGKVRVVADQIGSPTFAYDLAGATARILLRVRGDPLGALSEARGLYHVAGAGVASRYDLACAAVDLDPGRSVHRARLIVPVSTRERPLPAARPTYAPLDCRQVRSCFGVSLPHWRDALARFLHRTME